MKKVLALIFAITVAGMVSCSKSPEAEAKALITDMTKLTEMTAEKMDKAATAKDAGDALLVYAESMKKLAEQGKALEKKYPDMKVENNEKFKAEEEAMMKAMGTFTKSMTAVMTKYATAKEFQDAMAKMSEMMKN